MRAAVLPALIALGAAALLSNALAQQMYRWVDKEGRVHYSQHPPARDEARSVQQKKIGGGSVVEAQIPYALKLAMQDYPVFLYTSPNCKEGCSDARELLSKRGIPFREISVFDPQTNELLMKATGDKLVPSLTVGSLVRKGYEPEAINSLLDTAGYPRTPVYTGKLPLPGKDPQPPAERAPGETAPAPSEAAPAPAAQEAAKP